MTLYITSNPRVNVVIPGSSNIIILLENFVTVNYENITVLGKEQVSMMQNPVILSAELLKNHLYLRWYPIKDAETCR